MITSIVTSEAKFPFGQIVATAGVAAKMEEDTKFAKHVNTCLDRHLSGDWGDVDAEDWGHNDQSAFHGGKSMLLSAYKHKTHPKIWIITEWDRSVSTLLFPSEY